MRVGAVAPARGWNDTQRGELCGKSLSPDDRAAWNQAVALLLGLKLRNGFGDRDLAGAVGVTLATSGTSCEDCGLKVATVGLLYTQGGGAAPFVGLGQLATPKPPGWSPVNCAESPASHLRNGRE
jgi:hypothetical protein